MKKRILVLICIICMLFTISAVGLTADAAVVTHTITFDVRGIGETPAPITVKDGESYLYLRENGQNNPTADGYVFHCWVTTLDFEQDEVAMSNTAAYLETPITEDMTLYAVWYKLIDRVDLAVDVPVAGEVIGTDRYRSEDYSFEYQSPHPHAEVISEGAEVSISGWTGVGQITNWLEDADDPESVFKGTFKDGRTYGLMVMVQPQFGYEFTDRMTVSMNGVELDQPVTADYNLCVIRTPVLCGDATAQPAGNPGSIPTGGANLYVFLFPLMLLSAAAALYFRIRIKKLA